MDRPFLFHSGYEIPELWYNIASYCSRRSLQNLCLVGNRTFVDPAQRHLFTELAFEVHVKGLYGLQGRLLDDGKLEEYHARVSRTEERFMGIAASHLSQYVRCWNIVGAPLHSRQYLDHPRFLHHSKAIPQLISTLPQYSKVVLLSLASLELNSTTLASIGQLTTLKVLLCDELKYSCALSLPVPLQLEAFVVKTDYSGSDDPDEETVDPKSGTIFSPSHLKSLSLMHCLSTTVANFMSNILIDYKPHTNLVKLEMCVSSCDEDVPRLCHLLKASPLLEILRVIIESENQDEELEDELGSVELEEIHCPLLRDLTAPPSFAPVIAPGRPIRRYSMENYDSEYTFFSSEIVIESLEAFNPNILTELNFEKTHVEDARELLDFIKRHFPRLQSLRMPVNEVVESDDEISWQDPPQTRSDNTTPALQRADEGTYLHLICQVASGNVELPDSLTEFDFCMNPHYKQQAYTKGHEFTTASLFAAEKFKNLTKLRFGVDVKHNEHWKRNSQGLWQKTGWMHMIEEKTVIQTVVMEHHAGTGYVPNLIGTTEFWM